MTLNEISSAIRNHLSDGLRNLPNYAYSLIQLEDEIELERATIMKKLSMIDMMALKMQFAQTINCLTLDCEELERCCNVSSGNNVLHFKIPQLSDLAMDPVLFLGTPNRQYSFKVYTGQMDWQNNRYNPYLNKRPYVWIDTSTENPFDYNRLDPLFNPDMMPKAGSFQDAFVFNPPTSQLKYLSITAIFNNPMDVGVYSCNATCRDEQYPVADWVIQEIIGNITARWIEYYRKLNVSPIQLVNNQTNPFN